MHVPALDGLRGLAVLAVVAFHADLRWADGGFLGVDMFFVLSGFLITSLLRTEHLRRNAVSLPGFWSRRARRLLPALGFLCLGILVFAALRPEQPSLTDLRGDMLAGLGYVANWRFALQGGGYFTDFAPSPLRHLWSLAIEEQFYLLWPLVFLVVIRLRRPALFVAAAAVASAVLMAVAVDPSNPSNVYYGTHTHAHGLLLGAALAFVTVRASRWLPGAGIAAALAMLGCMVWFDGSDVWVYRGGLFAFELLTVVVIAACLQPRSTGLGRVLAWKPLCAVGLVSYGLYLWHWPVFVLVDEQLVGLAGSPLLAVQLVITTAVTVFSFFVIERPFRRGTLPGRHPVAFVPLAAGALVALLLVVTASLDSPIADAARAADRQTRLAAAHPGRMRIMIVGDSAAYSLAPGLQRRAAAVGMEVVNGAVPGCALDWEVTAVETTDGWAPLEGGRECDWRREWPKLIARYQPDIVLVSFGLWDATGRRAGGREIDVGSEAWSSRMREQARGAAVLLGRGGTDVVFLLTPRLRFWPVQPFNDVLASVALERGIPTYDLGPITEPGGLDFRYDGVHYTKLGADTVGSGLVEQLRPQLDADTALR